MASKRGSGIRINPANKGKLRRTAGAKKGQKVSKERLRQLKRSRNPTTRKRATFALNVREGKIGGKRKRR